MYAGIIKETAYAAEFIQTMPVTPISSTNIIFKAKLVSANKKVNFNKLVENWDVWNKYINGWIKADKSQKTVNAIRSCWFGKISFPIKRTIISLPHIYNKHVIITVGIIVNIVSL